MDDILTRISDSISAVDVQLDFERVQTRIRKKNAHSSPIGELTSAINEFSKDHVPSAAHALYFTDVLLLSLHEAKDAADQHDLLDCLAQLIDLPTTDCTYFLDSTKDGREVFKFVKTNDGLVRFDVLRILRSSYFVNSVRLVFALLQEPDLLGEVVELARVDVTEFVRNEAITFLVQLSLDPSNDLTTILTFHGVAESLFELLLEPETPKLVRIQAIQIVRNLMRSSPKCAQYISESGGCDQLISIIEFVLRPVLDHAAGVAEESYDPEEEAAMISENWTECMQLLSLIKLCQTSNISSLIEILLTCVSSSIMETGAEIECYSFLCEFAFEKKIQSYLSNFFNILFDEKTSRPIRDSIDKLIGSVLAHSETLREELLEQTATSDSELPGGIVSSILSYAETAADIPKESALEAQVWFCLSILSNLHICPNLVSVVVRLVGNSNNTVSTGALQVLAFWNVFLNMNVELASIAFQLIPTGTREGNIWCAFIGIGIARGEGTESLVKDVENFYKVWENMKKSIFFPKFFNLVLEMDLKLKEVLLNIYVSQTGIAYDESPIMLTNELEEKLAKIEQEFVDFRVRVNAGTEAILLENTQLRKLVYQLGEEIRVGESEIQRLSLMNSILENRA